MCSTVDSLPGLFCLEQLGYPVPMQPEEFKRLSSKMPRDTPGDSIGRGHTPPTARRFCVLLRRSLCRGPALSPTALSVGSALGPAILSQRSLCRAPTLSLSGSGALWVSLCRSPALFVSGPDAVYVRGLALFVSGSPGGPLSCVGARRLFVGCSVCRALALIVEVCVGARRSSPVTLCQALGPGALRQSLCRGPALCVGPRRSPISAPALIGPSVIGWVVPRAPNSGPPAPIRVPPIWPRAPSSDPRDTHPT